MPRGKRSDKRGAPGLYRSWKKNRRTGKLEPVGSFVIDKRIPEKLLPEFAGLPRRLKRSTSVPTNKKTAAAVVEEMKMMLDEIIFARDATTWRRLHNNDVTLPTLYAKWKSGRLHLIEPHENKPLIKEWLAYLDKANLADKTRTNRKAVVAALLRKGLIGEKDVLANLPERLAAMRARYEQDGHHSAFNTYRMEILTFLTKGLGFEDGSQLLHAVSRIKQLPPRKGRPHHPFASPRDMAELCAKILGRESDHRELYVYSVKFMCMHGLRPDEFGFRRFEVDSKTGHLKIRGTKNQNADRVVPLLLPVDPEFKPPHIDTLNRMFERIGVDQRCRDFRRTYSVWLEKAGVLQSDIRLYMGHGDSSVTHRYQRIVPTAEHLDRDQRKLKEWLETEMRRPRQAREKPGFMSDFDIMKMSGNQLHRLVKRAQQDEREVKRSKRDHHEH